MSRKIHFIFLISVTLTTADLQTAAITVYRNPEFFRHLSEEFNNHLHKFTTDSPGPSDEYEAPVDDNNYFHQYNSEFNPDYSPTENYHEQIVEHDDENEIKQHEDEESDNYNRNNNDDEDEQEDYKYPGEPKKPNPPGRPDVNVHYDPSPDFDAPPRDLNPSTPKNPSKGRGPYGHPRQSHENYVYDHGQLESIPNPTLSPPTVNDPEEYLGRENVHYPNHLQETVRETKKGTREYLKHNTLPANHELEDLRSLQRERERERERHRHRDRQPARVSCGSQIKAKKPRTFIAYKVRPIYPRYRVVPLNPNRFQTVYFVKRNARLAPPPPPPPKYTSDDSAYVINSAFDTDYQRLLKTN